MKTKEKVNEYARNTYNKYYRTTHKGYKGNKGSYKKLHNWDYLKWLEVYKHMYLMWKEHIVIKDTEGFFAGMKLKDFKMLWCDKKDLLNEMYKRLSDYDGYIY